MAASRRAILLVLDGCGWRYGAGTVGSWILEEPVHFFDMLMWYFESIGEPVSVHAFGNSKGRAEGMYDNFSTMLRFPHGLYAMVTQTLAGFEHHHVVEIVGSEGSVRTWWSGTMDRTLHPTFSLRAFDGESVQEVKIDKITGEVFELEDQMAMLVRAVRGGVERVSHAHRQLRYEQPVVVHRLEDVDDDERCRVEQEGSQKARYVN